MRSIFRSRTTIAAISALALTMLLIAAPCVSFGQQSDVAQQSGGPKKTRVVGVVKSVNGNTVTLTTDAGADINVTIQPTTRLMRMAPGQTDLKSATAIQLSAVQVGDRMLVGGTPGDDGKSVTATSAVIMKKSDVADKQQHDREEWQKNGVGGVVKSVDVSGNTITLSTGTVGAPNSMTLHVSKDTIVRRYAPVPIFAPPERFQGERIVLAALGEAAVRIGSTPLRRMMTCDGESAVPSVATIITASPLCN